MKITDALGTVRLHNGVQMPYVGLGVYKALENEVEKAMLYAFENNYRLVDTASYYHNEEEVGTALHNAVLPRESVFLTTKIWNDDHGYQSTFAAFDASLNKLQVDYLDLYLIHWPMPNYLETWQAMDELYQKGKIKAIGVCNCMPHHIESIKQAGFTVPMVNQSEFHPKLAQDELLQYCQNNNIVFQSWSPLMRGRVLEHPTLVKIAQEHKKSTAQIILRWHLQKGCTIIPKSVHKNRIAANIDVFDFALTQENMEAIALLNSNDRTGAHPDHFIEHFAKKEG